MRARVMLPVALVIMTLILPLSVQAEGQIHVVRTSENLTRIARRYCTTVWAIVRENGLRDPNHIWVGQRLHIPGDGCGTYAGGCCLVHVVTRGENLTKLARRYGTTVWAISRANGLYNPNYIWAGQRLCIPGGWCWIRKAIDSWTPEVLMLW